MTTKLTALKAIKAYCLDCSGGVRKEVTLCPRTACPLYIFRDGHNPHRKGMGNPNAFKKPAVEMGLFEEEEGDENEDS